MRQIRIKKELILPVLTSVLCVLGCGEEQGQEATGLTADQIQALAGVRGTLFLAGAEDSVFRLNNKTQSWERIPIGWVEAHSLAVDDTTLYVGTDSGGRGTNIYRLENDGKTFTKITPQGVSSNGLVLAADGNTIYASWDNGQIFRSKDRGENWHPLTNWEGALQRGAWFREYTSSITVQGNAIYVATPATAVFGSVDGGLKWNALTKGIPTSLVLDLQLYQNTLYAATTQGIYRLALGTTSFQPTGLSGISVNSLVASSTTLYAGSWLNGVFRSHDGGTHWEYIGLGGIKVSTLAVFENRLYVGTYSSDGLFYTDDRGKTWHPLNNGLIQERI